ncbi:TPA: hypothetical protein HA295_02710 [Candidatus Woesearchaeota archaeon]|nr:hypothetical protein [Candidatus Woesearchaeota archaeon]HII64377.1 hypothetical protein [Candidatus Woesearchaeota archaeon]HII65664.1 hypothetical protein [Candidatus Woesearchaeota archaeon]
MVSIPFPSFPKHEQPPPDTMPQMDFGSIERRVRALEQSLTNLRKIVQVTEENILVKNRHVATDIKTLTSDINELRRELHDLRDKMVLVIKEMQSLARQEDVKVLERYIAMWNPVKFVTQAQAEEVVEDILSRRKPKASAADQGE